MAQKVDTQRLRPSFAPRTLAEIVLLTELQGKI